MPAYYPPPSKTITFGIREITTGNRPDTAIIMPFSGRIVRWKLYSETSMTTSAYVVKNGSDISTLLSMTSSNTSSGNVSGWSNFNLSENDIIKINVNAKNNAALLILILVIETT